MRTLSPPLYLLSQQEHEHRVLEKAAEILEQRYVRGDVFTNPWLTRDYLRFKIGGSEREVFAVMLLDNQHRLVNLRGVISRDD